MPMLYTEKRTIILAREAAHATAKQDFPCFSPSKVTFCVCHQNDETRLLVCKHFCEYSGPRTAFPNISAATPPRMVMPSKISVHPRLSQYTFPNGQTRQRSTHYCARMHSHWHTQLRLQDVDTFTCPQYAIRRSYTSQSTDGFLLH